MDGNRRYAKRCNLKEGAGHRVGFLALMSTLKYCYELGVKYVTVYAFSIDNFRRRADEVQYVMDLMEEKIKELLKEEGIVNSYGVRVYFLGNLNLLNESTRVAAEEAMEVTAKYNKAVLLICVAYSSTDEIVHAVRESYDEKKQIKNDHDDDQDLAIQLKDIERHMYMNVGPDPDILVRTSGATRLSNFLLWQTSRCHLYSPAALWPEFSLWHLVWGVLNFQRYQPYLRKRIKLA
ncbi:hypothetical protein GIB67_030062 [Kingdonia uniflora]|uniref:Alkyl transferase n=1 Tax=Kingdonia uniflora TaxID=39325 RepID=A0A7J7MYC1_9MAGN|nr:hypothetical protein GIB67_030062 [Kingdonia uniflora]